MIIEKIEINHLNIPFKRKFKHALKTRKETNNIIIKVYSQNFIGIGESLPREYLTGEDINSVFFILENNLINKFKNINFNNFEEIISKIIEISKTINKKEISAFSALSDAILNLAAQFYNKNMIDLMKYLKIEINKKEIIQYSGILGENNQLITYIKSFIFKKRNLNQIKIKISPKSLKNIKIIKKNIKNKELRVDANTSFDLKNINQLIKTLNENNIKYLEQPFKVEDYNKKEIYELCKNSNIKIILDEDFCTYSDLEKFGDIGDIANLRLSKNGGIIMSLLLYKYLKKHNFKIILGCLVGETILSRYNIILANYLETIANEGNYDKFLFKKSIIENKNLKKNGNLEKNNYDINQKITLNNNFNEYILETKIF